MNRPNCIDISSRGRFRGKESIIWRQGRSPTDMTATLTVAKPQDLLSHVGRELGPSEWMTVDQALIDKFADATGDHQWIHVDVERAKRDMPGGKTIAHGYLTLSLVPRLGQTLYRVKHRSRGLNYGSDRVRFTGQVPAGSHSSAPEDQIRRTGRWRRAHHFGEYDRGRRRVPSCPRRRNHQHAIRLSRRHRRDESIRTVAV